MTSAIAAALRMLGKSIGKNLSMLVRAGLVENQPRRGYRITDQGREFMERDPRCKE